MTVTCPECGGSGRRMGTTQELECFDCSGEGQWTEEPKCACCEHPLDKNGWCSSCEEYDHLTETISDPFKRRAA